MPSKYDAIIFDLGNVLFDIDVSLCSKNIMSLLRDDIDKVRFREEFRQKNELLETGQITKEVFLNFILKYSRNDVNALDVIMAWNSILIGMPKKRLAWLERVSKKLPIYILSNINAFHLPKFKLILYEDHGVENFDTYFKQVFYSHLIGMRKPDVTTFKYVLSQIGCSPERTLFFDDTHKNVEQAQTLGINAQLVEGEHIENIFHRFVSL